MDQMVFVLMDLVFVMIATQVIIVKLKTYVATTIVTEMVLAMNLVCVTVMIVIQVVGAKL